MLERAPTGGAGTESLRQLIAADAEELSRQLQAHQVRTFPPTAQKGMRLFTPGEAADFIGIHEGYLRQVVADGHGPQPQPNGRRLYSVDDIERIRKVLDEGSAKGAGKYIRHRRDGERLQVISIMNFKGGSAKTTTAAHLAQYLSLRGYRVLAIDLDPQASLSAMFGHQPELDVGEGETIYGAIRYDESRRHISEIVLESHDPHRQRDDERREQQPCTSQLLPHIGDGRRELVLKTRSRGPAVVRGRSRVVLSFVGHFQVIP